MEELCKFDGGTIYTAISPYGVALVGFQREPGHCVIMAQTAIVDEEITLAAYLLNGEHRVAITKHVEGFGRIKMGELHKGV